MKLRIVLMAMFLTACHREAKDAPRVLPEQSSAKPSPYSGEYLRAKQSIDQLEKEFDALIPLAQKERERYLDCRRAGAFDVLDGILKANEKAPDDATITIGQLRTLRASMAKLKP